jgi:UDP-N-acetylmuramyl pentapeptide phosphotransferase/UDP-N-acetylglucosamine-1-phosphate transferase
MYDLISSFLTAFLVTYFAIPSIIKIAHEKNLCDEPNERRSHANSIPTLGGIGMFAGLIFSLTFWIPFQAEPGEVHSKIQYIFAAYTIIFLIGAKDDIIPLSPYKKLIGQILATAILVFKADIRLTSLYGVFGLYDIPHFFSVFISMFSILVIVNSLNLIDGINGLAGSIAAVISLSLGAWFFQYGRMDLAILSAALLGAIVAFLRYNYTPARIFMGDTGSLLLGLSSAILAISFIELNKIPHPHYFVQSAPAVAISVLIVPLFDTLRVFLLRSLRGKSPFSPDRTHIHHILIDLGFSHLQATGILVLVNLLFMFLGWSLQGLGTLNLALLVVGLATVLTGFAFWRLNLKRQRASRVNKN